MDLVTLHLDHPVTTSLVVAERFSKLHRHVLRDIRQLVADCDDVQFSGSNFGLVAYRDSKGERRPLYELTRDGFAILAMGFTGPEALRWKLAFLEAFNQMEAALSAQTTARHAALAAELSQATARLEQLEAGLFEAKPKWRKLRDVQAIYGASKAPAAVLQDAIRSKSRSTVYYNLRRMARFGLNSGRQLALTGV